MFRRSVGLLSACALAASALVLPQNLLSGDAVFTHHTIDANLQSIRLVRIPCAECSFSNLRPTKALGDGEAIQHDSLQPEVESYDLVLNFTTSNNGKGLELGGARIYPARFFLASFFNFQPVEVYQIPSHEALRGNTLEGTKAVPLRVTASRLKVMERSRKAGRDERVATLNYHIEGLEGRPFHLRPVEIVLTRQLSGLISLQTTESEPLRVDPASNRQSFSHHAKYTGQASAHCDLLPGPLCKLFNMFQTRPKCQGGRKGRGSQFKGLSWARLSGHRGGATKTTSAEKDGEHSRHHHHHQHHHGAHYRHGLLAAFARGFVAALIPILLGVFVGMTISLVGLLLGNIFSYLWTRFNRTQHSVYSRIDEPHETKPDLTAFADPPPQYSDHLSCPIKEKMDG